MTRKSLMTIVVIFIAPATLRQLCITMTIVIAFLKVQYKYAPFKSIAENKLQTGCLISSLVTLMCAIVLKETTADYITYLILVANIGSMVFMFWVFWNFTLAGYTEP